MNSAESFRNPFSAGAIRPGALSYLFPSGVSPETLVEQLRRQNWRGEIVGPHGSGKSTLLATLAQPLRQHGRQLVWYTLRQGERELIDPQPGPALEPAGTSDIGKPPSRWTGETLVVIDGAEQLSPWRRFLLRWQCAYRRCGLLWTTHQPLGLPLLWESQGDEATLQALVQQLLPARESDAVAPHEVSSAFAATAGNMREALFRLFDVYQRRG
jgi:hypothetical protein